MRKLDKAICILVSFSFLAAGTALAGHRSKGPRFKDASRVLERAAGGGFLGNAVVSWPAEIPPDQAAGVSAEGLSGAAWLDCNRDGRLDLFVVNTRGFKNALFQNRGRGKFREVGVDAGIADTDGYSGVVAGDLDNDGWTDVLVVGEGFVLFGRQSGPRVYRNLGPDPKRRHCRFEEIAERVMLPGPETATHAALADVDNDGDLDVFITAPGRGAPPIDVNQHPNKLYLNRLEDGELKFEDLTIAAGLDAEQDPNRDFRKGACAASFTDLDVDGDQDLIVANCNKLAPGFPYPVPPIPARFHVYRNDGVANGVPQFTDIAEDVGLGLDQAGLFMSTTLGDFDNDGHIDLFSTNFGAFPLPDGSFINFPQALFRNRGDGTFDNVTDAAGLDFPNDFGWGGVFGDFDNDGDLDLYYAGSIAWPFGFVTTSELGNPGRLMVNDGGRFTEAKLPESADLGFDFVSGVTQADYDHNGFTDILVIRRDASLKPFTPPPDLPVPPIAPLPPANETVPLLLKNRGNGNRWLTVRPIGTKSNRGGVGARIEVRTHRGPGQVREVRAGSSFASSESPWPSFGLGRARLVLVRMRWPSGRDEWFLVRSNRVATLREGSGFRVR